MKRLFLPLLIAGAGNLYAQQYHPLVDTNAVWNTEWYYTSSLWLSDSCPSVNGGRYFINGDTTINSIHYRFLKASNTYVYGWGNGFCYGMGLSYPDDSIYNIGLIREDSAHKVWFRGLSSYPPILYPGTCFCCSPLDADSLLYDFDANVGDTVSYHTESVAIPRIVTAVDSVQLLNGEWRKRITILDYTTHYWIEGIGSTEGLFQLLFFNCVTSLVCYRNANQQLYSGNEYSGLPSNCDSLFLGVPDVSNNVSSFSVAPNPTSAQLTVTFSSKDNLPVQLSIQNMLGEVVYEQKISSSQKNIDVSQLPAGIYLLRVTTTTGAQSVKWVKE